MGRRAVLAAFAALLACLIWSGSARAQDPVAGDFQKVTLDDNTQNPMELERSRWPSPRAPPIRTAGP
jgi:cytochrome c